MPLSVITPLRRVRADAGGVDVGPVRSTGRSMSSGGPQRPSESLLWTSTWCAPSPSALTVAAGMVASSETTEAVRLRAIGVPVPSAPTVSRKYSASVMVPPAARSSPVAETATSWLPFAGTSARLPLVVCGPGLGQVQDHRADDAPVAGGVEGADEDGVLAGVQARPATAVRDASPRRPVDDVPTVREGRRSSACRSPAPGRDGVVDDELGLGRPSSRRCVASLRSARDRDRRQPVRRVGRTRRGWTPGPTPSVHGGGACGVEEGHHAAEGELLRVGGVLAVVVQVAAPPRRPRPWPPGRSASSTSVSAVCPGSTARRHRRRRTAWGGRPAPPRAGRRRARSSRGSASRR